MKGAGPLEAFFTLLLAEIILGIQSCISERLDILVWLWVETEKSTKHFLLVEVDITAGRLIIATALALKSFRLVDVLPAALTEQQSMPLGLPIRAEILPRE
jgi:hypothetical protein